MNRVLSAMALTLVSAFPIAAAAQAVAAKSEALEEVVVTGTRKAGELATETLAPVDLISGKTITQMAAFDLTDSLPKLNTSLSTLRYPIADGTAFIRPVSLRNLSPDQTLVLVNGSRRHRSALVNLQNEPLGSVNQGSQAVDWSAFPATAIKRVEVLRDGASAQYGSDAIAGVINVILNDASSGSSLTTQYGEYTRGDGARFTVNGNIGLPLTADGFLNVSGEYSSSDRTWTGAARPDAVAVGETPGVGINNVPLRGLGQRWGDPQIDAWKFFVNAGITLSDKVELYGTGSYMDDTTVSDFFYRDPVLPTAADQLRVGSARTTLQIDCVPQPDPLPCISDGLPDPAAQSLVDGILTQGLKPSDYLTPDASSPSGYVLRNPINTKFPGGYNPLFGADLKDYQVDLGVRGAATSTLRWDARARMGENKVDYTLSQSINPSLGSLSPTSFHPGTLTQQESGVNLDFVKTFDGSPLNLAFGGEWRNETYKIGAGDTASVVAGPTAAIFGVGSDGFQGFPQESVGSFKSDSYAAYVDVETDLTKKLSGAVALRYENYQEFGNTFDWKVSGRYQFTDAFAARGTVNTGFRAPTPGQVNTLNVTTTSDSTGALIPNGTYPVSNPVALVLGAIPLKPETSLNYTAGLVWTATEITDVTLDFYHIKIDKRLALKQNTVQASDVPALTAAGVPFANLLVKSNANYFVNGFDSKVDGYDFAVTSRLSTGGGSLLVGLHYNYNRQQIDNIRLDSVDPSRIYDLENQVPKSRATLSLDYSRGGMVSGLMRLNYYGPWSTTGGLFCSDPKKIVCNKYSYRSKTLVDLEVRFDVTKHFNVAVGGENISDTYPDPEQDGTSQYLGVRHALTSPFGFNGAFFYARAGVSF